MVERQGAIETIKVSVSRVRPTCIRRERNPAKTKLLLYVPRPRPEPKVLESDQVHPAVTGQSRGEGEVPLCIAECLACGAGPRAFSEVEEKTSEKVGCRPSRQRRH